MTSTQDELVIALQQSVSRMDLPDDGPDLAVVRRRGTARRHRRRASAALCVAGVVGAVAAGVVVGVPDRPARDDTSAASVAPATSSRAQAEQVLDDVLTRADVGHVAHGDPSVGTIEAGGVSGYVGWNAYWPLQDAPDLELSVALWPSPPWDEPSPCDPSTADADPVRGCARSPLPDGGSVEVYEALRHGSWDEAGSVLPWEAWVPVATATYADGRRVTAEVGPAFLSRGAAAIANGVPPPVDVVPLDQLRTVVSDLALTTLGVPASDG